MAPHKPATEKKRPEPKKSEDKVVKRPARGYHKFRNGLLNVTPKGGEKELAKSNQKSPLLRLPPEIRNDIWKLVLGGHMYRAPYAYARMPKLRLSPGEPENAMSLLRTCRQIYAEASLMPATLNILSFPYVDQLGRIMRRLKAPQRRQVTTVRLELCNPDVFYQLGAYSFRRGKVHFPTLLPGLTTLHVIVFSTTSLDETAMRTTQDDIKRLLAPYIQGLRVDVKVEYTQLKWLDYHNSWMGVVPENVATVEDEV